METITQEKALFEGIVDKTGGRLKEMIAFAQSKNLLESLEDAMKRLARHNVRGQVVNLFNDFDRYSFCFEVMDGEECTLNGGVIYHGPHDGYGSGGAPTFSVTLTPTVGWSIHT